MKKINNLQPGRLEEIAIIVFFVLFFVLTIIAESTAQVNTNPGALINKVSERTITY